MVKVNMPAHLHLLISKRCIACGLLGSLNGVGML